MDVQLCIRALEMRSRHVPFVKIADTLGLANARAAQEAVKIGLHVTPAEDVRDVRRMCADELHEMAAAALADEENPGPLTSATGKIIIDETTGEPYQDVQARIAARRQRIDINKEIRKIYGADAPKQSVNWHQVLSSDEILALAAQMTTEAISAEREAIDGAIPGQIEGPGGTDG